MVSRGRDWPHECLAQCYRRLISGQKRRGGSGQGPRVLKISGLFGTSYSGVFSSLQAAQIAAGPARASTRTQAGVALSPHASVVPLPRSNLPPRSFVPAPLVHATKRALPTLQHDGLSADIGTPKSGIDSPTTAAPQPSPTRLRAISNGVAGVQPAARSSGTPSSKPRLRTVEPHRNIGHQSTEPYRSPGGASLPTPVNTSWLSTLWVPG